MGWIAIFTDGHIEKEGEGTGRPVQAGQDGLLLGVGQSDFGHTVMVDLKNGVFFLDWDDPWYCNQSKAVDIPIIELPEEERNRVLADNPEITTVNRMVPCQEPHSLEVQNGTIELHNIKYAFAVCEGDTNIVGEYAHLEQKLEPWFKCVRNNCSDEGDTDPKSKCKNGHKRTPLLQPDGTPVFVRMDILKPLDWRPVWFTRYTNGVPTKVIGVQTTTPTEMGGRNVQKVVSLFADGRIGID